MPRTCSKRVISSLFSLRTKFSKNLREHISNMRAIKQQSSSRAQQTLKWFPCRQRRCCTACYMLVSVFWFWFLIICVCVCVCVHLFRQSNLNFSLYHRARCCLVTIFLILQVRKCTQGHVMRGGSSNNSNSSGATAIQATTTTWNLSALFQ